MPSCVPTQLTRAASKSSRFGRLCSRYPRTHARGQVVLCIRGNCEGIWNTYTTPNAKEGGLTEKGEKVSASISVTTIHYMIYAEAASRLEQSLSCVMRYMTVNDR